jgi:antitoxin (DNA-binding transcriptional repressor) of toxin-antitoxin stability system
MPRTVTVHEAKTQLSKLLEQTERGERIIIARGRHPVAELSAIKRPRVLGRQAADIGIIPDDFCAEDPEILEMFGLK